MNQPNEWISFSIFSPRKEWPRILCALDTFLSSDTVKDLTVMRIIEINYLYGSNIRLFMLPAAGKSLPLTVQMQTFFRNNLKTHVIPGMNTNIPTANTAALHIRVLLSDIIIATFRSEGIDDETLFTMALFLHLTLLKKKKVGIALLLSYAGTPILLEDPVTTMGHLEEEYSDNRELLHEMQSDISLNNDEDLPGWLPAWIKGYEAIMDSVPEHSLPALYRCTVYFIIKQLGLTGPLVARLEYFIKKMAEGEIIHS